MSRNNPALEVVRAAQRKPQAKPQSTDNSQVNEVNERVRELLDAACQATVQAMEPGAKPLACKAAARAIIDAAQSLAATRGPSSLGRMMPSNTPDFPRRAELALLVELLRLGCDGRESPITEALAAITDPALRRFVEWLGPVADALCGKEFIRFEGGQGLRVAQQRPNGIDRGVIDLALGLVRRPSYRRDQTWLSWKLQGLTPAQIRDKWNAGHSEQVSVDIVKTAIKRASAENR